jgi:RNA polymerase sigma factor (sigma-70 family)
MAPTAQAHPRQTPLADFASAGPELWAIAYKVAYRILLSRPSAEDAAQDTLVRVALKWKAVEDHAAPFTAHVAAQTALGTWRREHRPLPLSTAAAAVTPADDRVADRDALLGALRRLPRRQREVIVLRYIADLSQHDTATALGCTEGTVSRHAKRGLDALRTHLEAKREA